MMNDKETIPDYPSWVHERSALVQIMLHDGLTHIMCEGSDEDKDFDKFEGNIVVINSAEERTHPNRIVFIDVNGEEWCAVQPIKPNGHVMNYDGYLKLKGIL